jgi:hypothetical protein
MCAAPLSASSSRESTCAAMEMVERKNLATEGPWRRPRTFWLLQSS